MSGWGALRGVLRGVIVGSSMGVELVLGAR